MSDSYAKSTRQVIDRVYLAPERVVGDWTVDDLRDFVSACDEAGVSGSARVRREEASVFGSDGRKFYTERVTEIPR